MGQVRWTRRLRAQRGRLALAAARRVAAAHGRLQQLHIFGDALRHWRNWRASAPARGPGGRPSYLDPDGTFGAPADELEWRLLERLVLQLGPNQAHGAAICTNLLRSGHLRKARRTVRVRLRFSQASEHQDLGASHPRSALSLGLGTEVGTSGAHFVLANAPSPHAVHADRGYREDVQRYYAVADLDYAERRLRSLAAAASIAFVPLAEPLRDEAGRTGQCVSGFPDAVPCYGHWNRVGHRIVGEQVARAICDGLLEFPNQ